MNVITYVLLAAKSPDATVVIVAFPTTLAEANTIFVILSNTVYKQPGLMATPGLPHF